MDIETIYEVPLRFEELGLANLVAKRLGLPERPANLAEWEEIIERIKHRRMKCPLEWWENTRAMAMLTSRLQSLSNTAGSPAIPSEHTLVDSEGLERGTWRSAWRHGCHCGVRRFRRPRGGGQDQRHKIRPRAQGPVPRLCYGMQMAVIEFARNVCKLKAPTLRNAPGFSAPGDPHPAGTKRRG